MITVISFTTFVNLHSIDFAGPNKVEDNLPDYPGFERDVFKVVKDYFEGLAEPLLTFSMYEVFTNVFGELKKREFQEYFLSCKT